MALSPSHQFGQLIGDFLEDFTGVLLREFVGSHHGLYLDYKKNNRPARKGKKISWIDDQGNVHDLDFVVEKNGTDSTIGTPAAFIESAWRRYTKHSRNKAQEIQAAILPLAEKYRLSNPFLGVVLAGDFTANSMYQLRSCGFSVLYFPYKKLTSAFKKANIDIFFDEKTPDEVFAKRINSLAKIPTAKRQRIQECLRNDLKQEIEIFLSGLHKRFDRQVSRIVVLHLWGITNSFASVRKAISFLKMLEGPVGCMDSIRYEIQLIFSNGDEMKASFEMKGDAVKFLSDYTR